MYLALIETEEGKRIFERLYIEYKQTMFYAANRILNDCYAAEDAVQEAFLRVINHLDKVDEKNRPKTRAFLVVIVEHISIDIYRKRKRENIVSYDEIEIYVHNKKTIAESPHAVVAALASLPIDYSTVLQLKFSQGYNDTEIAKILNLNEENVRKRIYRAKKKLAQYLTGMDE